MQAVLPYATPNVCMLYSVHKIRPCPGRVIIEPNTKYVSIGYPSERGDVQEITPTCCGTFTSEDMAVPYLDCIIKECNARNILVFTKRSLKISSLGTGKFVCTFNSGEMYSHIAGLEEVKLTE